jgi:aryl-alcohol dehydrogenase
LIALNQQGRYPYNQLIKFHDFADINEAISDAENGGVLKPVIRFNGG